MSWPRSLLARNAALIVALVLGAQVITIVSHLMLVQAPRARQLAELTGDYVTVLERALSAAPEAERHRILAEARTPRLRFETGSTPAAAETNWLLSLFAARIQNMAPDRRIVITAGLDQSIWIESRIGERQLWVVSEARGIITDNVNNWLLVSIAGVGIGLGGALLINRRINRPLTDLAAAARRVGAGDKAPPLPERGPTELASVSMAFNRMVRDLDALEKDRAMMLAGISHDLRTPLTRVRIAAEMLGPEADRDLVERIIGNVDRVDRTLGQFLAFARDETIEPPRFTDANGLAAEVVEAQTKSGPDIRLDLGQLPEIEVRPLALSRAIENLVVNATRHGRAPFTLRTSGDAQSIRIAMIDHGDGIADADAARMLQPFQQLRPDYGRSAGLGLAIVDRIARLHGGRTIFRRLENGTFEASLELPLSHP